MQAYKILEKIQEKEHTLVCKAKKTNSEREFIIKKLSINPETGISVSSVREIRVLKKLKSSFVVELCEIFVEEKSIFIVTEYLPYTLAGLISLKFVFSPDQFDSIVFQLFQATEFIHKQGMIHRNLNPKNILLDSKCRLKLTSFEHTRFTSESMTNDVTTVSYRAPELLLGDTKYTNKIDSWSIGCILIEMKTGKPPFNAKDEISQCKLILKTLGIPDCEYPWNNLFTIQQYSQQEIPEQTFYKAFTSIFEDKMLFAIKELLQLNKNKRLSVHNALKLPVIRRGEKIECSIHIN